MRFYILAIAAFLYAVSALAQMQANAETFCRLLPEYKPALGVEYQPGVDVNGDFVAPADLPRKKIRNFQSIEVPIEMSLIQKFGLNVPPAVDLKPVVALISIHNDGKVDYNGQDITHQAYQLCDDAFPAKAGNLKQ